MASENARAVAREILGNIGKGEKASVRKIAPKHGYSKKTANSGQIQKTQTYKDEIKPFVERLIKERERLLSAIEKKGLTKERYKDAVDSLDKLTKNIQLLSGGATERVDNFNDEQIDTIADRIAKRKGSNGSASSEKGTD